MLNLDDIPEINLDLVAMKAEISRVQTECCKRGLNQSTKWLAEINFAMKTTPLPADQVPAPELSPGPDLDTYSLAKSYFDLKEYDRAAYFTRDKNSPLCKFLHLYSRSVSVSVEEGDHSNPGLTAGTCPQRRRDWTTWWTRSPPPTPPSSPP